jgi:hypothetical protein
MVDPQFGRLQAVDVRSEIANLRFNRLRNGLIFGVAGIPDHWGVGPDPAASATAFSSLEVVVTILSANVKRTGGVMHRFYIRFAA